MRLTINGEEREFELGASHVEALLDALGHSGRAGIAIALNGEVVRRAEWRGAALSEGDRIDIVGAVQGG